MYPGTYPTHSDEANMLFGLYRLKGFKGAFDDDKATSFSLGFFLSHSSVFGSHGWTYLVSNLVVGEKTFSFFQGGPF